MELGGESPQTIRAQCGAIRYCPDPLGIVTAEQPDKLELADKKSGHCEPRRGVAIPLNDVQSTDNTVGRGLAPADGVVADRFENVCNCADGSVADVIYEKIPGILNFDLDKRK